METPTLRFIKRFNEAAIAVASLQKQMDANSKAYEAEIQGLKNLVVQKNAWLTRKNAEILELKAVAPTKTEKLLLEFLDIMNQPSCAWEWQGHVIHELEDLAARVAALHLNRDEATIIFDSLQVQRLKKLMAEKDLEIIELKEEAERLREDIQALHEAEAGKPGL